MLRDVQQRKQDSIVKQKQLREVQILPPKRINSWLNRELLKFMRLQELWESKDKLTRRLLLRLLEPKLQLKMKQNDSKKRNKLKKMPKESKKLNKQRKKLLKLEKIRRIRNENKKGRSKKMLKLLRNFRLPRKLDRLKLLRTRSLRQIKTLKRLFNLQLKRTKLLMPMPLPQQEPRQ